MPRAIITSQSLLLTAHGWLSVESAAPNEKIAGIDRHGKPVSGSITIRALSTPIRPVFLGASLCCGVFSPSSAIQDSTGSALELAGIAKMGYVGDLRFETQLFQDEAQAGEIALLWVALRGEAAFCEKSTAIIRCRSASSVCDVATHFSYVEHRSGRRYCKINEDNLKGGSSKRTAILDEVAQVFRNDDGASMFSRAALCIPMVVAASWAQQRRSYELLYDTLQHTAVIGLRTPSKDDTGLSAARCAATLAHEYFESELFWKESDWSPICNGFILVGR